MELKISKFMFLMLTVTGVTSILLLLQPTPLLNIQTNIVAASEIAAVDKKTTPSSLIVSWVRKPTPEWKLPNEKKDVKKTTAIAQLEVAPVVIAPPKPSAPNPPFSFLGKMIDNERSFVFLSDGINPIVVSKGDIIRKVWRVEKITPTFVELNYLPLDEIRQVFIK